jgi:low temperature requirement protein LtrA
VTALRYAGGISVMQVAWAGLLILPQPLVLPAFVISAALEVAVPVWAERHAGTPWHPHHIAERYGLFTVIVLGESILAATLALEAALGTGEATVALAPIVIGGLLIVFAMWWVYFDWPVHDLLTSLPRAVVWGYGHYLIFASAAAVGAGLAVSIDVATDHAKTSAAVAGAAVTVPVAIYLACLWYLHDRPEYRRTRAFGPIAVAAVLVATFTGQAVLLTGLILAGLVAVKVALLGGPGSRSAAEEMGHG